MPIYAYKCDSCGHSLEILQKLSDPPARDCPSCGASALVKQVTAAGFQLKGSGWYVTDFRGGQSAAPASDKPDDKSEAKPADPSATSPQPAGTTASPADKPGSASPTPAAASTPAPEAKPSSVTKPKPAGG